jgi:hypothetical protein
MPTENKTRQAALNAATNAADRRLRELHQDEWNSFKAEEAALRNEEWEPKKNEEEKAAAQLADILAKFPSLVDEVKFSSFDTPSTSDIRERLEDSTT